MFKRTTITLMLSLLPCSLVARELPDDLKTRYEQLKTNLAVPSQCIEEAFDYDYASCVKYRPVCDGSACLKGYVHQFYYVLVEKSLYPSSEDVVNRFINFDQWTSGCEQDCDPEILRFQQSNIITLEQNDQNQTTYTEQYSRYSAQVKEGIINLGWHNIVSFTKFWRMPAAEGQEATVFFAVDNQPDLTKMTALNKDTITPTPAPFVSSKGLEFQFGLASLKDYNQDYWLITYGHDIRITKDLVPAIGGKILNRVIFNILDSIFEWDYLLFDPDLLVTIKED